MTLATALPSFRAAFRERLRTCVDLDVTVAVTAAGGVFTRASGSWVNDGFAIGQELTLSGVSTLCIVNGVTADKLTTSATSLPSGSVRFQAKLPNAIAWEGQKFTPASSPFVAERVQKAATVRRGGGPQGTIEHRLLGHANLFYPARGSTLAIERMAGALMLHFKPGTALVRGADASTVQEVEQSPLMLDGEWLSMAVTVTALAHTSD